MEAIDDPEDKTEDDAEENRGGQGKEDRPSSASPGEVSREAAEGEMESREDNDDQSGHDEGESEEDEGATEVGHDGELRAGEHGVGLAEEFGGLAGLGEDAHGTGQFAGLFAHVLQVGVEAGEDDDAAGWELAGDVVHQGEAVLARHGDIAEEQVRDKLTGALEGLIGGVCGLCVKAILREDEGQCVGDQTVIVNDQNSLHG